MGTRLELHELLVSILANCEEVKIENPAKRVFFQPPESVRLSYPCIIYSLDYQQHRHADNIKYMSQRRYTVNLITRDPDTELLGKISEIQYCSFNRLYTADNLYHYVFSIYY